MHTDPSMRIPEDLDKQSGRIMDKQSGRIMDKQSGRFLNRTGNVIDRQRLCSISEQRRCLYDESLSGVKINAHHNTDFIQKGAVSP
jgi:hypothetical protein